MRIVDLEIAVEEDEHAARQRLLQELLRHGVEALERLGGDEDELDRQAETARQRRRLERGDAHAGDLADFLLNDRLQRIGGLRALIPGFRHHAGDRLAGDVELEHVLGLLMRGENLVDLARIHLALLQGGVGRRDRLGDDDALVLGRRQLGFGAGEQKVDAEEHDGGEHQRHRQRIQAAVQPAFV